MNDSILHVPWDVADRRDFLPHYGVSGADNNETIRFRTGSVRVGRTNATEL